LSRIGSSTRFKSIEKSLQNTLQEYDELRKTHAQSLMASSMLNRHGASGFSNQTTYRGQSEIDPIYQIAASFPGVGNYQEAEFYSRKRRGGRNHMSNLAQSVICGTSVLSNLKNQPNISFTRTIKESDRKETQRSPGPGRYESKKGLMERSMSSLMGTSTLHVSIMTNKTKKKHK